MNRRRDIQQQHERAVVADFIHWFRQCRRVAFRVVAEPNPPEAIIQSKRLTSWVEVVDVFWSREWARDQYSFATHGERHVPIESQIHIGSDDSFANSFVDAVSKKLEKSSYVPIANEYGPGYLVVNIDYPLFNSRSLHKVKALWTEGQPWANKGCFKKVFLRIRVLDGYAFKAWTV